MRKMADRRLRLVLALSLAAFTVVVFRAAQIQVVDAAALSRKAVSQQRAVVPLPGLRGAILSADGQHLAQEQTSKTIVADKAQLRHPHHAAVVIARALGYHQLQKRHHPKHHKKQKYRPNPAWPGRVKAIEDQLQQGGGGILRQLQPEVAARIMAQHLPGISTVTELTRWYPFHGLAPQVIGYTQVDGPGRPDGAGVAGIEQQYNKVLTGTPGRQVVVHDPVGQALETVQLQRPVPGRDVTLTLDTTIQAKVESVLAQTVKSSRAKWATGIVLDPRTGSILAMATAPGYDNNKVHTLTDFSPTGPTQNNALVTTYEPGSTYKVVTFSAALSTGPDLPAHGVPEPAVEDPGRRQVHPRRRVAQARLLRRDPDPPEVVQRRHRHDRPDGREAAPHALDPQVRVRPARRARLPRRVAGHRACPAASWTASSIGTIPIGQGIGVTAMQMASMYQAIANGGVMVPPRLVQAIGGHQIKPQCRAPGAHARGRPRAGRHARDGRAGRRHRLQGLDLRLLRGRQDGNRAEAR